MPEVRRFASAGRADLSLVEAAFTNSLKASLKGNLDFQGLEEFESIAKNPDPETFWGELHQFAGRLREAGKSEAALAVYGGILEAGPADAQESARKEADAHLGRASGGRRAEVLIGSFVQQASDHRTMVPLLLGFSLGRLVRGGALLTGARATPSILTRGWGIRTSAGAAALSAELPVFVGASRALSPKSESSFETDLARAALTLGAFKVAGGAAQWIPLRRDSVLFGAISQAGIFGALLGAHSLEGRLGLRPEVDGATAFADALAATLSLGVSAHLSRRILGDGLLQMEREMELRVRNRIDKVDGPVFSDPPPEPPP